MPNLDKIADGIYISESTRKIQPAPSELVHKPLQNTLGHVESEEILAAFMYASKPHGQWTALEYDRLYEQICKHIVLTQASAQRKRGTNLPEEIQTYLDSGEYYPTFALHMRIIEGKKNLKREIESICDVVGYKARKPVFMLKESVVREVFEKQSPETTYH